MKKKIKTVKSICRGNVNTACWVAVHLVGKMHLSLGGIAGSVSFSTAVSEQAGYLGPKAAPGLGPFLGSVDGRAPLATGSQQS